MLGLSRTGALKLAASRLDQIVALKANKPTEASDLGSFAGSSSQIYESPTNAAR